MKRLSDREKLMVSLYGRQRPYRVTLTQTRRLHHSLDQPARARKNKTGYVMAKSAKDAIRKAYAHFDVAVVSGENLPILTLRARDIRAKRTKPTNDFSGFDFTIFAAKI